MDENNIDQTTLNGSAEHNFVSNNHINNNRNARFTDDESYWDIENENIILDQVSMLTTTNAAAIATNESDIAENCAELCKIEENVNLTLNNDNISCNVKISSDNTESTTNDLTATLTSKISLETKESNSDNAKLEDNNLTTSHANSIQTENIANKNQSINLDIKCESATASTDLTVSTTTTATNDATANTTAEVQLNSNTELEKVAEPATSTTGTTTAVDKKDNVAQVQSLDEFKEELRIKRLARQTAVQDLRDEISNLKAQLAAEQALTHRLHRRDSGEYVAAEAETTAALSIPDEDDEDPISRSRHANIELADAQLALQLSQAENLSLRTELAAVQKQVGTLKEVVSCCKQMLAVKEEQCSEVNIMDWKRLYSLMYLYE